MENASKALLITGGILIGIILLSLIVYMYGKISESQRLRSSELTQEQIARYNEEFLSYQKNVMYGTDVITVLNKAIDNNKKFENDKSYEMNVKFILKEEVYAYNMEYNYDEKTGKLLSREMKKDNKAKYFFSAETPYDLDKNFNEIKEFLDTKNDETNTQYYIKGRKYDYYIHYSGFSEFKRKVFKCVDLQYNEIGLINYMEFKEISNVAK